MKKNILLVEYDDSTIETIKEILSSPIFNISLAEDGEAAKKLLKDNKFNLVITAAMLPKFHGFQLSQYIAENFPETYIIIISGVYKGIEYKQQALSQFKANAFLEKPINKIELKDNILDILDLNKKDLETDLIKDKTQIAKFDTEKIPKIQEDQEVEKNEFTSDDLFADIIEKVEKTPSFEIKLENEEAENLEKPEIEIKKEEKIKDTEIKKETQEIITKEPYIEVLDLKFENVLLDEEKPETEKYQTRKLNINNISDKRIDLELKDITKTKPEPKKEDKISKKIEDDIGKKLEQTLSGLGIKKSIPKTKKEDKITKIKPEDPEKDIKKKPPIIEKKDELGNYDLLGLIARGGMAEIYKAKKKGVKGFEKIIAIKKILPGFGEDDKYIEMLVDEAKIAAELSHPNIVQIYDLGRKDDYYFIAMEYILGKDLRLILTRLLVQDKLFPEEISIYLIIKVLEALSYAHSVKDVHGKHLKIVHRDISPPNIIISYNGDIKLTDFGIAKASNRIHQTISGSLKGKILYMSPEQARGDKDIDSRSDLYSVGVILFELITGKKLFLDSSEMAILKKVQDADIVNLTEIKKDIDPELENIILKSLKKDKNMRYQNASDMAKDLESYITKNYDHTPVPAHISNFIYNLSKDEIINNNIEVNLKPIPFEIKKISDKVEKIVEEKKVVKKEEVKISKKEKKPEHKKEPIKKEELKPSIEINFEEPESTEEKKPTKPITKKEIKESEYFSIESEIEKLEKDGKHKSKTFLIAIIIIAIIGAGIYFLIIKPTSKERSSSITTSSVVKSSEKKDELKKDEIKTSEELDPLEEATKTEPEEKSTISEKEISSTESKIKSQTLSAEKPKPDKKILSDQSTKTKEKTKQVPQKPRTYTEKKEDKKQRKLGEIVTSKEKPEKTAEETKSETEELKKSEVIETQKPIIEKKPEPVKLIIKQGDTVAKADTDAIPISTPNPTITRKIRRSLKSSETIVVRFLVDHNGNIERIKLIKKSNSSDLNLLIYSTVGNWKYKSAIKDNVRVKIWKTKTISIKK